jgi:peptidoglycan hydrolase CwlO-like protein
MAKTPNAERIKALENVNAQLIEKINRLKAQVRHNDALLRKWKRRQLPAERLNRQEQSERDKKKAREKLAAAYRAGIEQRISDCLRMNGMMI